MNRPNQVLTFRRICMHELKVLAELSLLNVVIAGVIWSLGIPYEVGLPILFFAVIRTKCYDRNLTRNVSILPVSLHWTRLSLGVVVFILHAYTLSLNDVETKTGTFRMAHFDYSQLFLELSFVSTIFSLGAIMIRFWLSTAQAGRDVFNQVRLSVTQEAGNVLGPAGDGPIPPLNPILHQNPLYPDGGPELVAN